MRARFKAAEDHHPLCALSPSAAQELEECLATAATLDDLPGKWQAALLEAEAAAAGGLPAHAGCRCSHHATGRVAGRSVGQAPVDD